MIEEIISEDREFGVVLIERGNEVGGGDVRKNVGTLAKIIDFEKSRIVVTNALYEDFNYKKIVYDPIKKGK